VSRHHSWEKCVQYRTTIQASIQKQKRFISARHQTLPQGPQPDTWHSSVPDRSCGKLHDTTQEQDSQCVHRMFIGYSLVAASAAGEVLLYDEQRSLAVGSYPGGQCHSRCERTCLQSTFPPVNTRLSICMPAGPPTVHLHASWPCAHRSSCSMDSSRSPSGISSGSGSAEPPAVQAKATTQHNNTVWRNLLWNLGIALASERNRSYPLHVYCPILSVERSRSLSVNSGTR
jgi:hypothetical protein